VRKIAFYGKGGIGKSTIASNISLAFRQDNQHVLQIGCDPKCDSAQHHVNPELIVTAMDVFRTRNSSDPRGLLGDVLMKGRNGVDCIEAGGPEPGTGCAGRSISLLLDVFNLSDSIEENYDAIIYDVLGDVVCGGFATPIRTGHAKEIYVVTSGELMSLYAANNIVHGFMNLATDDLRMPGIIANLRGLEHEKQAVMRFAARIGLPLIAALPRDNRHVIAELNSQCILEYDPKSSASRSLKNLYETIRDIDLSIIHTPSPIPRAQWHQFAKSLLETETQPA
jgi:nitrogenase iron protein NifH